MFDKLTKTELRQLHHVLICAAEQTRVRRYSNVYRSMCREMRILSREAGEAYYRELLDKNDRMST